MIRPRSISIKLLCKPASESTPVSTNIWGVRAFVWSLETSEWNTPSFFLKTLKTAILDFLARYCRKVSTSAPDLCVDILRRAVTLPHQVAPDITTFFDALLAPSTPPTLVDTLVSMLRDHLLPENTLSHALPLLTPHIASNPTLISADFVRFAVAQRLPPTPPAQIPTGFRLSEIAEISLGIHDQSKEYIISSSSNPEKLSCLVDAESLEVWEAREGFNPHRREKSRIPVSLQITPSSADVPSISLFHLHLFKSNEPACTVSLWVSETGKSSMIRRIFGPSQYNSDFVAIPLSPSDIPSSRGPMTYIFKFTALADNQSIRIRKLFAFGSREIVSKPCVAIPTFTLSSTLRMLIDPLINLVDDSNDIEPLENLVVILFFMLIESFLHRYLTGFSFPFDSVLFLIGRPNVPPKIRIFRIASSS